MYHVISSLVFAYMLLHLSDLSYISRFVSHTFTRTARERERGEGGAGGAQQSGLPLEISDGRK